MRCQRLVGTVVEIGAAMLGAIGAAVPAHADSIVIQEVCYDGASSDAAEAFTELLGTPGMDLTGWLLVGIDGADGSVYRSLSLSGAVVPDDGILVIATSSASGLVLAARDFVLNVDWQNGPDAIRLIDPSGTVMDALAYGAGLTLGEGQAAADVAAGWSLTRDFCGTDTGDNATDFLGVASPTPGFCGTPTPEPATLLLVLAGGGGLALSAARRRRQPG
jgi:hypothetical protein